MTNYITEYIESGILELYIMGQVTAAEAEEVEQMAAAHVAVRQELSAIQETMAQYTLAHAVKPRLLVKSLFLATINYMERLQQGEPVTYPPLLSAASCVADYNAWLTREDLVPLITPEDIYISIIGHTPEVTTALVWLTDKADPEVHDKEYERFLVAEGTCTITAGNEFIYLTPGDYYEVPLYTPHSIKVTSALPCKVILQRVAIV